MEQMYTTYSKMLVLNNSENTVFTELKKLLETCNKFYFNVAFVNFGGLQLFLKTFSELENKNVKGQILTSTYLNFSDPKAIKKIKSFENVKVKVYDDVKSRGFHSKAYIFEYDDCYKVIIGSSNLTASALKSNIEWNVEIISKKDDPFLVDVLDEFTEIWDTLDEVTDEFLVQYESFLKKIRNKNKFKNQESIEYEYEIQPNAMQIRALENLNRIRKYGGNKGLVIAATGTGKTYVSAFDVQQFRPKKVLFVVHREEILRKAEKSFRRVLGNIQSCFFVGIEKETDGKYIFTTIQTLHKYCALFDKDDFDYIIIDEAHHIAGEMYQKVLNYFEPKFLLGMTATPERCDNFDIFEAFDHNVAIEVRLHEAMEESLVVPFHYFGITDIEEASLKGVSLDNKKEISNRLSSYQRVDYIIKQMELYGHDGDYRKCLGFCVSIEHAEFMANEFNKRGICSICLTGSNNSDERQEYMNRLEDDKDPLEVIFTVDIFNEGIDIPSINMVLMLRPTNSPIVFIQQLGRGLRKNKNKEYLTVLDFIGNHNRVFLIAIALKGSRYYDKDSLKVSVSNDFVSIPGDTYIQMDPISKDRILRQLDKENFSSYKYTKQEYLAFKSLLNGNIPYYLMDYIKYDGSPDPVKLLRSAKKVNYPGSKDKHAATYINFLACVENLPQFNHLVTDRIFVNALKYLSDLLPIRRPHEYAILLDLVMKGTMSFNDCKESVLKYINDTNDDTVKHSLETLNFTYYDSLQIPRWEKLVNIEDDNIKLSQSIEKVLENEEKKHYIVDTLRYGLERYKREFEEENYGLPYLKLYEQYTKQEVAMVSNSRKMFSSYREGVCINGNEFFLFVNLHKDSKVKESINYKDKFLSRKVFQWQSQNQTTQNSSVGQAIIFNKEKGNNIHLFIRKFDVVDNVVQPYIYVGKVNVIKYEGEKPITFQMRLEKELPATLYSELITKVEIDSLIA